MSPIQKNINPNIIIIIIIITITIIIKTIINVNVVNSAISNAIHMNLKEIIYHFHEIIVTIVILYHFDMENTKKKPLEHQISNGFFFDDFRVISFAHGKVHRIITNRDFYI
jgi:hypothetical protein